jgi:DNA replication and repair protein RecF
MYIESLEAIHFRNLKPLKLCLSPKMVMVRGGNANGKTNLLEALYVCATGRSFRNATSRQLLQHGQEQGRVKARFFRQSVRHEIEVLLSPKRRGVRVDEKGVRRASRLLELVNVVAFFPDDLRIAKGSPEERRRFLDRTVANYLPPFVDAAIAYDKVLKSRNALLRQEPRVDPLMLETYDQQLLTHGEAIYRARVQTLSALAPDATARFGHIMGGSPSLEFRLLSGLSEDRWVAPEEYRDAFLAALRQSYPRDRARGTTSVGPHRCDLKMILEGQDARLFASQGQQRALVLALKLAEVSHLRERLQCAPILLLDDVSSELDASRTQFLFEAIAEMDTQVWISTTGATSLPTVSETQVLSIENGVLSGGF